MDELLKLNAQIEEYVKKKAIKPGQKINYETFLELYTPFSSKMSEVEFARVLEISTPLYYKIKKNKSNTTVFKSKIHTLSEEEIETIKLDLSNRGVKKNQKINYIEFLELYEPYKNKLSEKEFANILGISHQHLNILQKKSSYATVWKTSNTTISSNDKQRIFEELKAIVHVGQQINYNEFRKLYSSYSSKLSEIQFSEILKISPGTYYAMRKDPSKKVTIWKVKNRKIEDEEKEHIYEELKQRGVKSGQKINYEYFQRIYEPYREKLSETDFASILGISYGNFKKIQKGRSNAIIRAFGYKEKIQRIKFLLDKENRFYSKEELSQIASSYELSLEQLICEVFTGKYGKKLFDSLKENGRIYIGKTNLSKEFLKNNHKNIQDLILKIANNICINYNCQYFTEDVTLSCLEYVIFMCGDIELNFKDSFLENIKERINRYIKNQCFKEIYRQKKILKQLNIDTNESNGNYTRELEDKSQDVEAQVLKNSTEASENQYILKIKEYIHNGLNAEKALERTSADFGIDIGTLKKKLKQHYIHTRKVVMNKDGFSFGEDF